MTITINGKDYVINSQKDIDAIYERFLIKMRPYERLTYSKNDCKFVNCDE
jgi:hypothetical protein